MPATIGNCERETVHGEQNEMMRNGTIIWGDLKRDNFKAVKKLEDGELDVSKCCMGE